MQSPLSDALSDAEVVRLASGGDPLDDFARDLDATFGASTRVEDVALPTRRSPRSVPAAVNIVPPADPSGLICALDCRHYTTHVRRFPTRNEEHDGVIRSVREHRCRLLGEDLQDEQVYECSSWSPVLWRRLLLQCRSRLPKHIVKRATPEQLAPPAGLRACPGCHLSLECSGVVNPDERRRLNPDLSKWCWCGHREARPATWEEALGRPD